MISGKHRQVPVENLDDELGNIGGLPLLLLRLLNEQGEDPVEWFEELPWIKDNLPGYCSIAMSFCRLVLNEVDRGSRGRFLFGGCESRQLHYGLIINLKYYA